MSATPNHAQENQNSGSPLSGEPEFLAVGKLLRPHGLRGELHLAVWTDFPERLQPGVILYAGEARHPLQIRSIRGHALEPVIAFEEIGDRETAAQFRNQVLFVPTASLPPLPEDEIYLHQLIGLQVIRDEDEAPLGVIAEIIETGANDVFVVRRPNRPDWLLPDIASVVLQINLQKGEMRICPLPGLLPDALETF